MTPPLRESDSKIQRLQSLVREKVDSLLRCPSGRKGRATREALSKLKPHVDAQLEALETLDWLRDLTDEELERQRMFTMLLCVVKQDEYK